MNDCAYVKEIIPNVDINTNYDGKNILFYAAETNNFLLFKTLVNIGADINKYVYGIQHKIIHSLLLAVCLKNNKNLVKLSLSNNVLFITI